MTLVSVQLHLPTFLSHIPRESEPAIPDSEDFLYFFITFDIKLKFFNPEILM